VDHILVEAEQKRLLSLLVEITRSVTHVKRQPTGLIGADGFHQLVVAHPSVSPEHPPQVPGVEGPYLVGCGGRTYIRIGWDSRREATP